MVARVNSLRFTTSGEKRLTIKVKTRRTEMKRNCLEFPASTMTSCSATSMVLGLFSNTIQGIEGAILLAIAHGFVSPALFICVGGIIYDRTGTRIINYQSTGKSFF